MCTCFFQKRFTPKKKKNCFKIGELIRKQYQVIEQYRKGESITLNDSIDSETTTTTTTTTTNNTSEPQPVKPSSPQRSSHATTAVLDLTQPTDSQSSDLHVATPLRTSATASPLLTTPFSPELVELSTPPPQRTTIVEVSDDDDDDDDDDNDNDDGDDSHNQQSRDTSQNSVNLDHLDDDELKQKCELYGIDTASRQDMIAHVIIYLVFFKQNFFFY